MVITTEPMILGRQTNQRNERWTLYRLKLAVLSYYFKMKWLLCTNKSEGLEDSYILRNSECKSRKTVLKGKVILVISKRASCKIFTLCKHPHFLLLFCRCSYTKQSLDSYHLHPLFNVRVERVIKYVLQDMAQDNCLNVVHIFYWNCFSQK
jgi:hypothetical protein